MFLEGQNSTKFAKSPTQWATLIPTVYNADTLGIRPDLIKRPIGNWKELLNPEFKGRGRDPQHSLDRHHGCGDGRESSGRIQISRQGQHEQCAEIDRTMKVPDRGQESGQFRASGRLQRELSTLMKASGRDRDPVDVVAGCDGSESRMRYRLVVSPAAGRGLSCLGSGLSTSRKASGTYGKKADLAYEFHQLGPRWLGRRLPQSPRLLFGRAGSSERPAWSPYEWAFWMEGKAAEKTSRPWTGTHRLEQAEAPSAMEALRRAHWVLSPVGMLSWI